MTLIVSHVRAEWNKCKRLYSIDCKQWSWMSRILGPIQDPLWYQLSEEARMFYGKTTLNIMGPSPPEAHHFHFLKKNSEEGILNYSSHNHLLIIMLAGGNESWNLKQLGITSLPVPGLSSEELFNWIAICQRGIELAFEPYIIFFIIIKISKQEFQQRKTSPLSHCRNVLLWTKACFELFPNTPGLWSD